MHTFVLPSWFGLTLTTLVCGAAFWKGGREEQLAAGGLLLAWAATLLLRDHAWLDQKWLGPQWGAFAADVGFLAVLVALALRSERFWPMAAAAFQLLAVVTHAARIADPGVGAWAYATAGVIWTQLVLLAMAVGVWGAWKRGQPAKAGVDPSTDPGATLR